MTACTVRRHYAGLFSELNKVVQCADLYGRVHVDWTDSVYGEKEENLWNHLFEPTEPCGGEEITTYPDPSITGAEAGKLYESGQEWRTQYNKAFRKVLPVKREITTRIGELHEEHLEGRHVIGVIVRFDGHFGEQPSNRSQSLHEYAAAIEALRQENSIVHVMAGDMETIAWFESRYPTTFVKETRRTETRAVDQMHFAKTIEDAKICLIEVALMACADVLIHPVSNMATAALYMNPNLKSVYLK